MDVNNSFRHTRRKYIETHNTMRVELANLQHTKRASAVLTKVMVEFVMSLTQKPYVHRAESGNPSRVDKHENPITCVIT